MDAQWCWIPLDQVESYEKELIAGAEEEERFLPKQYIHFSLNKIRFLMTKTHRVIIVRPQYARLLLCDCFVRL